jgi:hypothetical protein
MLADAMHQNERHPKWEELLSLVKRGVPTPIR